VFGDELSRLREFEEFPLDLLCFYELTLVLEVGHALEVVGRALAVFPGFFLILRPQVVLEIRQFGRESWAFGAFLFDNGAEEAFNIESDAFIVELVEYLLPLLPRNDQVVDI
jgi:hypothetical protein